MPASVRSEVDRLVARGVPGARAAAILARTFPEVPVESRGDRAIVEAAVRLEAWVVTADRDLTRRLRARGLGVLVPRDRHRLELRPGLARSPPPAVHPSKRRRTRVGNG